MTKYIKQRLSVKIFIITFFLLGAACGGTYFFISKLLPVTYSNLINASTEKAAMHLVEQMTAFDNISDCENDISIFSKETNAAFWIEDSNGRMIYPAEASMETSTTSADCTVTFDEDESFIDMQPSGETTTNFYPFTLKNGTAYALAVQTNLFVVQQATKVLLSILPYVILMVFLLSLLCAWLYTRYITRPIVQLSKISKQMAELDFSGQCGTGREDELGCLSLSETHGTIRGEIENTGVRVPDDAIPHLFEAFYRADTSRNRNTGGTGLGLYIVRKVMEMHRANYGISNINNGVLFWFELPCKQPVDNSI